MFLNHLYVTMTPDSLAEYQTMLRWSKLEIDHNPILTVIVSGDEIKPEPGSVYRGTADVLDLFYSVAVGSSSALLPITTTDLEQRFIELAALQDVRPYWGPHYFPALTLIRHFPPLKRINRTHLSRLSEALMGKVFEFGSEEVEHREFFGEPNSEYNQLMMQSNFRT